MRVMIDERILARDIEKANARLKAVSDTVTEAGVGEVVVSKRPKLPHERANKRKGRAGQRTLHGRAIANMLRRRGHDPFVYQRNRARRIEKFTQDSIYKAIEKAEKTSQSQKRRTRRIVTETARRYSILAVTQIRTGQLGKNQGRYRAVKAGMVRGGIATSKYGVPPPYGVLTGRFIKGIRHRWRLGRGR